MMLKRPILHGSLFWKVSSRALFQLSHLRFITFPVPAFAEVWSERLAGWLGPVSSLRIVSSPRNESRADGENGQLHAIL